MRQRNIVFLGNKYSTYFLFFICFLLLILIFPCGISAQKKDKAKENVAPAIEQPQNTPIYTEQPDNQTANKKVITEYFIDLPENQKQLALGGGYFFPLGEMSGVLDPNWCAKLIIRINNIQGTLFGLGIDLSYAGLKDLEYDGNFYYITALPYASATIPLFNIVQLQAKACAGFSALYSNINGVSDGSLCLTLGAGLGFFRVFAKHYMTGFDFNYSYYFQMHTSSSMAINFYIGYNF